MDLDGCTQGSLCSPHPCVHSQKVSYYDIAKTVHNQAQIHRNECHIIGLGASLHHCFHLASKTMQQVCAQLLRFRIKYDAYRLRIEDLKSATGSARDASYAAKIREAESAFQVHKQKYNRIHGDLIIKLRFLEENKVRILLRLSLSEI